MLCTQFVMLPFNIEHFKKKP